mmetsp:Transcript_25328/g.35505  ORF Transcript_25328/g.35505 Transcript_25328/m.35505 type:complete len:83 (-) Transcript_25328:65-313(-)
MSDMIPSLVVFSACVGAILVLPKWAHWAFAGEDAGKQRWGYDRFERALRVRDMNIKGREKAKKKYIEQRQKYLEKVDKTASK